MADPARLYLIDGTALVYRAHFALLRNPLVTTKGEVVSAVHGVAQTLMQLLQSQKPRYLAVAFDSKGPTFRHERYAAYKAHRPPMPDDLAAQLPRVRELVDALGLCRLEQEGVEADDIIGSLARQAVEEGREVVIVSSDKDFTQLISDRVRQWIPPGPGSDAQWIDPDGVRARWGVGPDQMVELLALMGDASDNVPGVAGVGPKTAAQLLQDFGSLDGIYARLEELGRKSVRSKLEKDRENAYLSLELVRIRTDWKSPVPLEDLRVPDPAFRPQVVALFKELEFRRLLESLGQGGEERAWRSETRILDTPEALDAALADWAASRPPLALDTETTSLDPRRAAIVGISLAWKPGHAFYIPLGHVEGRNLPVESAVHRLGPILSDTGVTVIGQNLKYDLHVLSSIGLSVGGPLRDTLLAAYLIDPGTERAHNLDALSRAHLNHRMIPIEDLIGKGRNQITMDQVPVARVAAYSGEDVDVTLRLHPILEVRLGGQELRDLWSELECPLVRVLLRMEQEGVLLDTDLLRVLSQSMEVDLKRLTEEIHRAAGQEFNISSPAQLGQVLFETLRLPKKKKTKTGYSTDQEVLEELAELHPVPRLVLEHRSLTKLKGTYVDALPQLVDPRTGRIHANFNQMVAATGRLSSSEPNLQNIPIRSARGREIRSAFVAAPGHLLISADYSQIELRVLAHLSEDQGLLEAFREGVDVHAATAERIFGVRRDQVGPDLRARAKTVNFGVIYGMGPQRLARDLGIALAEAREFIEAYFARLPGVKTYMERTLAQARADGYVTTILGRRRPMGDLRSSDARTRAQAERQVANTPIQGSAADIIKRAMLAADGELRRRRLTARMILQVHDELVLEVPENEVEEASALLRGAMETAAALRVPLKVDLGRGRSWTEAHA